MATLPHVCFLALNAYPVMSGDRHLRAVGGAEVQQAVLARALVREGYRVSMICFDHGQPDELEIDGIRLLRTFRPMAGSSPLRFLHPRLTSVWRAMARAGADVYYQQCPGYETAMVASFCRRHGKRSVYAAGSNADFVPGQVNLRGRPHRWLYQWGLRNVDRIVTQNPTQQRMCRERYGRGSSVIPNMFRDDSAGEGDRGGPIVWVANMRRVKRPELFVELARRLPGRRFVMAGGVYESDEAYLSKIQAAARAVPNLEFRGYVPYADVGHVFDGASLLVCTSEVEGFPNTFLQAWTRGIPVVSFFDTGFRVGDDAAEYLVGTLDEAEQAVTRLLASEEAWRAAGRRAKAHFEAAHSVDALMRRYRELFGGEPGANTGD